MNAGQLVSRFRVHARSSFRRWSAAVVAAFCCLAVSLAEGAENFGLYARKAYITFDGYAGASTLTNFPVLVKISDGVGGFLYSASLKPNGGDVRFSLGDGIELPSEVASWNPSGTSEFWVLVPELSAATRIMMFWGNASAGPRRAPAEVWCNDYASVWHLDDAGAVVRDSSPNGMHGAAGFPSGAPEGVAGACRIFDASRSQRAFCGGGSAAFRLPRFSYEVWFNLSEYPTSEKSLFFGIGAPSGWNAGAGVGVNSAGAVTYWVGAKRAAIMPESGPVSLNAWHLLTLCQDNSAAGTDRMKIYLDGELIGSINGTTGWNSSQVYTGFTIGGQSNKGDWTQDICVSGSFDECRVSRVPRSADYIAAVYRNIADYADFLKIESEPAEMSEIQSEGIVRDEPGNGVRYVSAGETQLFADGIEVASAPDNAHHVVALQPTKKEYRITISAGDGGIVQPAGEIWIEAGATLSVKATPDAGKGFYMWSGDSPGLKEHDASIVLLADKPRTLSAQFGTLRRVSADAATDEGADGSAANPFATVQAAIDASAAGDVVLVGAGTYNLNGDVATISKGIAVRAEDGPGTAVFEQNHTYKGISMSNPGALVEGLTVRHAKVISGSGYAIKSSGGHILDCDFIASTNTSGTGSASYISAGWISRCRFYGNFFTAGSGNGGDRQVLYASGSSTIIDSCVFTNNVDPTTYGGNSAVVRLDQGATIRNTLIADNTHSANYRCAVAVRKNEKIPSIIENCTIAGNIAGKSSAAGAAVQASGNYTVIFNSILEGNSVVQSVNGNNVPVSSGYAYLNSICGEIPTVDGCIDSEAGFRDCANGDYSLKGTSPAIDSGMQTVLSRQPGAADVMGGIRVNGKGVDMGAFEYVSNGSEPLECTFAMSATKGDGTLTATFTPTVIGNRDGIRYLWNFGDGTTSTEEVPTHTYTVAGKYTVRLDVATYNGALVRESSFKEIADAASVLPLKVYVRAPGASVPAYPYDREEIAADSLFTISSSEYAYGVEVDVDGVVNVGGEANFIKPARIVGHGRERSVIKGGSASYSDGVFINANGTYPAGDSLVANVKFTDTLKTTMAKARSLTICGVVTNCLFTNIGDANTGMKGAVELKAGSTIIDSEINTVKSKWAPNQVKGIQISGGGVLVDRCVVKGIVDENGGGQSVPLAIGVMGLYSPAPVIRNTLVFNNQCQIGTGSAAVCGAMGLNGPAVVENCTVVSNKIASAGAGIRVASAGVVLRNTIAWYNSNISGIGTNDFFVAGSVSCELERNCSPDLAGVAGNFAFEPLFNYNLKPSEPFWSLQGRSPCRNKGKVEAWMAESFDLAGRQRAIGRPEIGCYEIATPIGLSIVLR